MAVQALPERTTAGVSGSVWRRPDVLLAVPVGAAAIALAHYLLLLQVTNVRTMIEKTSHHPGYLVALMVLVPLTFVLFGSNFALAGLMFRLRSGRRNQIGSLTGAVVGSFGAACPSCGAFLLTLVGVTAGLSALPFAGLEIWAAAAAIMLFTLVRSIRAIDRAVCSTDTAGATCRDLPRVDPRQVLATATVGLALVASIAALVVNNEPHLR